MGATWDGITQAEWRTLRAARGERAVDIAARQGKDHLVAPLTPVLVATVDPEHLVALQNSWSRVVGGSGQRHEITADATLLIDEGFV